MNFSLIKVILFMIIFIIFSSTYLMHVFYKENTITIRVTKPFNNSVAKKNYLIYTPGCSIPKYDPFDLSVRRYYLKTPYVYKCSPKKTLFQVRNNGLITLNEETLFLEHKLRRNEIDCTFRPITRRNSGRKPDDVFLLGKEHDMIFDLPIEDDAILLKCKSGNRTLKPIPLLLTPLKEKVEKRCESILKNPRGDRLSVIIVGIDSISKLNFLRYFKKTLQLLRNELSAIELNGFTKVADNTYPNLIPFLTGRQRNHYRYKERKFSYFDDVDFVWKRYADAGYRTLFSEDAPSMGAFVLNRRGFRNPPTDYYSRPFSVAVDTLNLRHKTHCIGNHLEMETYFEYLRNFLTTMEDRLVFSFTFVARLTHDVFKYAGYADKPSFELISSLKEIGALNKSLLIFFSDHGIRFGDIRRTYIGKIEERMPFMFLLFPEWFLKKYPNYARNLEINKSRLTTPYDIHATLLHLLDLNREFFYTLHGQSLLTEITPERTCADAMISKHWCTCQEHRLISTSNSNVRKAAISVVRKLNILLKPYMRLCAPLKLNKILDARIVQPNKDLYEATVKEYLITLDVTPSGAIFEATLQMRRNLFVVIDEVSRINRYGNQSICVDDTILKKYCFCKHILVNNNN